MQPKLETPNRSVHEQYRQLLRAGFTPQESAALMAFAAGIARHAEGESPVATAWRLQEVCQIDFMAHLARNGRLGGFDDGGRSDADRSRPDR